MEAKPFSIGFRIEHPQSVIDRARWGRHAGHPLLGAADYKLVHHAAKRPRGVQLCMCPGGTGGGRHQRAHRVVTNGMSQYSRNERNANAGMVVGIDPRDYPHDPLRSRPPGPDLWRGARPPAVPSRCRAACCSASSNQRAGWAGATTARRASWWANSLRASRPQLAAWNLVQARRGPGRPARRPARLRHRGLREALPAFGRRSRALTCATRC